MFNFDFSHPGPARRATLLQYARVWNLREQRDVTAQVSRQALEMSL